MTLSTQEGVIKFQLDFETGPPPSSSSLQELEAWRKIFCQLGLLGQDPARYHGYGFGNLSRRCPDQEGDAFLISGTQTGHLPALLPRDYARVTDCAPKANWLKASGQTRPSSEALSHAVLYQKRREISWVMHLHSPEIFQLRESLHLPCTDPAAAYGTPEMANEIERLASNQLGATPGLLIMSGHEDGILAYGSSAADTGSLVIRTLALALQQSGQAIT